MIINIDGYHGTSKDFVEKIKNDGFDESDNGWFGAGVYMYESSFDMAYKWSINKYKSKAVVLYAEIEVEEPRLFDLTNPNGDDARVFHDTRARKFRKYKGQYRDQLDNIVINSLHKLFDFHVVKGISHSYEKYDKGKKLGSNVPNGIEVVVREKDCIKSICEME